MQTMTPEEKNKQLVEQQKIIREQIQTIQQSDNDQTSEEIDDTR